MNSNAIEINIFLFHYLYLYLYGFVVTMLYAPQINHNCLLLLYTSKRMVNVLKDIYYRTFVVFTDQWYTGRVLNLFSTYRIDCIIA